MLKVLDLFSGIGGFSLGLERTGGFETVAFCEIDEKARRVLRKHWPAVPIFNNVAGLTRDVIAEAVPSGIDVVTGGFPCQDISLAGKGAGLAGERSGLWYEFYRVIKETRPKYTIIENVAALRSRGLDAILWGLAEIGYDAEWHCIPASAVGAPHRRDRVWVLAHTACAVGNGNRAIEEEKSSGLTDCRIITDIRRSSQWEIEPNVDRLVDGFPGRVDRVKQLGNAVVPQVVESIGYNILEYERGLK